MTKNERTKVSKFLSLVLRHKPETINLELDENGWADTQVLLTKINVNGIRLTLEGLKEIVETNDKKRFAFTSDLSKIRANQGHSIGVDLKLEEQAPPDMLYHGTADKNLESIKEKGLLKGQRHHVHLSENKSTAIQVGQRYGKPIVLTIRAGEMNQKGKKFLLSSNGVWLTDFVSSEYIDFE